MTSIKDYYLIACAEFLKKVKDIEPNSIMGLVIGAINNNVTDEQLETLYMALPYVDPLLFETAFQKIRSSLSKKGWYVFDDKKDIVYIKPDEDYKIAYKDDLINNFLEGIEIYKEELEDLLTKDNLSTLRALNEEFNKKLYPPQLSESYFSKLKSLKKDIIPPSPVALEKEIKPEIKIEKNTPVSGRILLYYDNKQVGEGTFSIKKRRVDYKYLLKNFADHNLKGEIEEALGKNYPKNVYKFYNHNP